MALTDDQRAMLRLLAQREQGYDDIAALTGGSVDGVRAKVKEALVALDGSGAPSGDQRAMLRLLAQREEGYGDIAALTGQSVDDVRNKVRAALSELEGAASPAAKPPPEPEPEPPGSTPEPSPQRRAEPRPVPTSPPVPPAEKAAAKAGGGRLKLPDDRGAVWGLGAGLAVVLVLVILLATGALGGGSESNSSSSESTTSNSESGSGSETSGTSESGGSNTNASSESLKPTQAVLKPVGGSEASGRALFGKAKKQVVILLRAKGLEAAPKGQTYTVSLSKSSDERLPLIATQVNKAGELVGTFPIAPQVLGLIASGFDEMEVSIVTNGELSAALKAARQAKKAPNYGGTTVLSGQLTGAIVEAGEQGKVKP
jgi:hypothetical protein